MTAPARCVRITQLDGKLPNLALMRLSAWHKSQGDAVHFSRSPTPDLFEPRYDVVYGSAIFSFSAERVARLRAQWPEAIIGGTGTGNAVTVEELTGAGDAPSDLDYSLYPWFQPSIGFTQRGCRLSCKFCVVPKKEGRARSVLSIADIWRGEGHQRNILLLDNDFFGQERDYWEARIGEIRDGNFRVAFSQGINVRAVGKSEAEALASVRYSDDDFKRPRLYTAWDNLKDEEMFFRGVNTLHDAGIPPYHLMVYMLVGYDKRETWERIWHRYGRMVAAGVRPYPMVYDCRATDPERYRQLKRFQRWVITGAHKVAPFSEYSTARAKRSLEAAT